MQTLKVDIPDKLAFLFEPMRYKVAKGGRGSGKCLGLGTPVLMFDGSIKSVEDVVVGDKVMGPDSTPRTVLSTTSGESELFEVKQTSAMTYVVNDEHILSLKKSISCAKDVGVSSAGNPRRPRGRYPDYPDIVNIGVREYVEKSKRWKDNFRGYRAGVIDFPEREVPVDPYLLGIWLGDGLHRELMITNADEEIIKWMSDFCDDNDLIFTSGGKKDNAARDYRLGKNPARHKRTNLIWQGFKELNVVSNKHVPEIYIGNSEKVRLELLAGLLDSDGHMCRNGYAITQKNYEIARGAKRLADTLGFRTSINKKKTKCSNNGATGVAWTVAINGSTWRIPCKVERKKVLRENCRPLKDKMLSYITVSSLGVGKYAGFSVDGDHLFCLGDGTVTHNSWSFARSLLVHGISKPIRVLCAREVQKSIKDSVHRLLSDQIDLMGLGKYYEVLESEIRGTNGTQFSFAGLSIHTVDSIKSYEGVDICWVEEGQAVSKRSWDILIPTIRKAGSEIWVSYNPDLETDETHVRFAVNTPENCVTCHINYSDNPWFNDVMEAERLHCQKFSPKDYPNIWEGKCRPAAEGAIYYDEMQDCQDQGRICRVLYDPMLKVHVIIDLGWNDTLSIAMVQRNLSELRVIDYLESSHKTLDWYSTELKKRNYNWGGVYLPHDGFSGNIASGGKTCADTLRQLGWTVPGRESIVEVDVEGGIRLARMSLARTYFDKEKTKKLVEHLKRYKRSINRTTQTAGAPLHDEHSHGADCYRYIAVNEGLMKNTAARTRRLPPPPNWRVA